MRKYLAIILISFGFFSLQGGKIAVYLLCKWQMEVVQKNPDCDCEKHLSDADGNASSQLPTGILKQKPGEHFATDFYSLNIANPYFKFPLAWRYASRCSAGFIASCFHPPSVV